MISHLLRCKDNGGNIVTRKRLHFAIAVLAVLAVALSVINFLPILPMSVAAVEYPVRGKVTASPSLYFRTGPGTGYSALGVIPYDTEVDVLGETSGERIGDIDTWYRVRYLNSEGYVFGRWIEFIEWEPPEDPAADPAFEAELTKQGFPESYKPALRRLHAKYPAWKFVSVKTDFSFDYAVDGQYLPGKSINYVPASSPDATKSKAPGDYNESTGNYTYYEPGWVAASRGIIAYQMDPRNFLDEQHIFMFESLSYDATAHHHQGVAKMLANTFMAGSGPIEYTTTDNTIAELDMSYADIFMEAAQTSKVSPYHLVSRVRQEVGNQGSISCSGKNKGLEGYYNFYNIGAYGGPNPALEGVKFAKNGYKNNPTGNKRILIPWTSPRKAIVGGAIFLGHDFINAGQETLYLQKFNLRGGYPFWHQYMANVFAPMTEGRIVYNGYRKDNTLSDSKVFAIPVFTAMPQYPVPYPETAKSPINHLASISVNGNKVLGFHRSNHRYVYDVYGDNNTIKLTAEKVSPVSTVSGTGTFSLKKGENRFNIYVTAQDGGVRLYSLNVRYLGIPDPRDDTPRVSSSLRIDETGIYGVETAGGANDTEAVLATFEYPEDSEAVIVDLNGKVVDGLAATGDRVIVQRIGAADPAAEEADGSPILFERPLIIYGDITGDGYVDSADVEVLTDVLLGYTDLDPAQILAADINRDGAVNVLDLQILSESVGSPSN